MPRPDVSLAPEHTVLVVVECQDGVVARISTIIGWFRTGDRGHLRPGGHLEVTGRTKDLIIRKGEKIAPLELETLLIQHLE